MMPQRMQCDDAPLRPAPVTGGGGGTTRKPSAGPAEVVAFPIARRVAFLERMADCVWGCRDRARYLARACEQQREAMRRRALSEEIIESEIASFEREIMWRLDASVDHG